MYTVTAENGDTKTYTATIDIAFTAESDRAALMAIYNANPEAQDGLTGWGSEQPLNDWYGVDTNDQGRVIGISLRRKGLKVLPAEIGDLTALVQLTLNDNNLTSIPAAIGNLTALEHLLLYSNQLETIPSAIGNLTALVQLRLDHNNLTSIPAAIGNLTALEYLYLFANKLNSIPAEIGNLTALKRLYLNNNPNLTSIPASVCTLGNSLGSEFKVDEGLCG